MLRRFATLFSPVQSCSMMLNVVQSNLKVVKNFQLTRLNFFCFKKIFSRFATSLNIVKFAQAHCNEQVTAWCSLLAPLCRKLQVLIFDIDMQVNGSLSSCKKSLCEG